MTPTYKGNSLYFQMVDKIPDLLSPNDAHDTAKKCAIICCDEIITAINGVSWMEVQNLDRENAYWESVKKHIQSL